MRASLFTCLALALGGCAPSYTGIDLEVHGADATDANQLRVTGTLGDDGGWRSPSEMARIPADADRRPFGAVEDVRILLSDDWADRVVFVNVELLHDDQPARAGDGTVVPAFDGASVLVRGRTKRIRACFTGLACPPATM